MKCEGLKHRFPPDSWICYCGKIDRRKKMMQIFVNESYYPD